MDIESAVGLSYVGLAFVMMFPIAWVWDKKLPKDAPMGLIMGMFIPAFSHLYIYRAKSLWYVGGLIVLGKVLQDLVGITYSMVGVAVVSFGLMYWRLVVKREQEQEKAAPRLSVTLDLDAETQTRLNGLAASLGVSRAEVVRRALEFLPGGKGKA